jgi:carboxylesterase
MGEPTIIPGAEARSVPGGDVGALLLHGFGGNPATMGPLADALAAAGLAVEVPRLPGHGTVVADLVPTSFADWLAAAEDAYAALAARCRAVVVAGLSMGATLTAWLAADHPEVAGIVCINPAAAPREPELLEMVRLMLDAGEVVSEGAGPDIADPDATESAYTDTPLAAVLTFYEALDALQPRLGDITCPVLVLTSTEDHVVDPAESDHLAARVGGPVERVALERSYHVATLDHDRHVVAERTLAFVEAVAASVR